MPGLAELASSAKSEGCELSLALVASQAVQPDLKLQLNKHFRIVTSLNAKSSPSSSGASTGLKVLVEAGFPVPASRTIALKTQDGNIRAQPKPSNIDCPGIGQAFAG